MCEKCDAIAHKLGLRDSLQLEQIIMVDLLKKAETHRQDAESQLNEEERQCRLESNDKYAALHMVDKCIINALVRVLVTYSVSHCLDMLTVSAILSREFISTLKTTQRNTDLNFS